MTTNNHPTTTTASNDSAIRFRSGRAVDKGFYDAIKAHVLERMPSLEPALIYKSPKVCGKDFWECLEDGERNLAGESILHMAIHREVPLELAGKSSDNHQLYRVAVGYRAKRESCTAICHSPRPSTSTQCVAPHSRTQATHLGTNFRRPSPPPSASPRVATTHLLDESGS